MGPCLTGALDSGAPGDTWTTTTALQKVLRGATARDNAAACIKSAPQNPARLTAFPNSQEIAEGLRLPDIYFR
jgi:hypothetical protein